MKTFSKLILASAALVCMGAAQAATVIDALTTTQTAITDTTVDGVGVASTAGSVGDTSILGGFRDLYVNKINGSTINNSMIGVDEDGLSFASGSSGTGLGIVRWDGNGAGEQNMNGMTSAAAIASINATGLGGADITEGGGNIGFMINVTFADLNFPFTLQAFTNSGNWATISLTSTGAGAYFVPFAAFNAGLISPGNPVSLGDATVTTFGSGVNFGNLGALQAIINYPGTPTTAVDLTITLVRAVPEPGSLALVGLALVSAGLARRKYAARA